MVFEHPKIAHFMNTAQMMMEGFLFRRATVFGSFRD
jgi:hypothetical protein